MTSAKPVLLISSSVGLSPNPALIEQWLKPVAARLSGIQAFVPAELKPLFPQGQTIAYSGPLSMVRHAPLWRPLAADGPLEIHIIGSGERARDTDALAIAAYLPASSIIHHSLERETEDLTRTLAPLRIDFRQAHPTGRRLNEEEGRRLKAEITHKYVDVLVKNGWQVPRNANPQDQVRARFNNAVGLAQDLVMRAPSISGYPWWATGFTPDGAMYETLDNRVAYARLLERLPGVESALEVGCGSGLVTLMLSGSPTRTLRHLEGGDVAEQRVEGARLLADLSGLSATFKTMSADGLSYPDKSFDLVFTCFVLEQCVDILDHALDECMRVARKFVVLFEPSAEAYPTLPGLIHIPSNGFPADYMQRLMKRGLAFSVVRPPIANFLNSSAIYVINVETSTPPHILQPDILNDVPVHAV